MKLLQSTKYLALSMEHRLNTLLIAVAQFFREKIETDGGRQQQPEEDFRNAANVSRHSAEESLFLLVTRANPKTTFRISVVV